MGCWIETKKFGLKLAGLNCYIWNDKQLSKDVTSTYIDLRYDAMMSVPPKHVAHVILGDFSDLFDLYNFNSFVTDKGEDVELVVMNFNMDNVLVDRSLKFNRIDFIGSFSIANSKFKKDVVFNECNINSKAYITRNVFLGTLKLNVATGSNMIFFNNNKLAYLFDLYYNDKLLINSIELINEQAEYIEFNQYFEHISKTYDKFSELRTVYNFIKNHFQQYNNNISSNAFYALEMLAHAKELDMLCKSKNATLNTKLDAIVFMINKFTSNQGQSILLPILWIIVLTVLCALAQWYANKDGFYWLGVIFFPYFPDIDYKELNRDWKNQLLLFGYLSAKSISAMLWWQLTRAIRKDIKR